MTAKMSGARTSTMRENNSYFQLGRSRKIFGSDQHEGPAAEAGSQSTYKHNVWEQWSGSPLWRIILEMMRKDCLGHS